MRTWKKQTLIFSYVQRNTNSVIWTPDLMGALNMAKVNDEGIPLVTAHNRKSRRYMDKIVRILMKDI